MGISLQMKLLKIVYYLISRNLILLLIILLFSACSSKDKNKLTNQELNQYIPEWFFENKTKKGYIFSNGVGESSDLQLSLNIAVLNAKLGLADKLQSTLSGLTKSYSVQSRKQEVQNQIEQTIKNLVTDVDVSGYELVNKEIKRGETTYKSFVKIEYDVTKKTEFIIKNIETKIESSFKELDDEIGNKNE